MLAKPPMFRKPCRKNQNSPQPDRTPAPPQLENTTLPFVDARSRIINLLGSLGLWFFLGGPAFFSISGNAFIAKGVTVSGMIIIVISSVFENVSLPSVYPRIMTLLIYLGYGLVIAGLAFILIGGNPFDFVAQSMLLLGVLVLGIHFVKWIWPWLRKIWHFTVGKLILTWLHAVVLWLAAVYARKLVAEALGLPPQDFDMTVAACTLIFYIPVWLVLFSLLAGIICVILIVFSFLVSIPSSLVLVSMLFPEFIAKQQRRAFRSFTNALGARGAVGAIALVEGQLPAFTKRIEPVIRGIAYVADFQEVSVYPGVDTNRKLRLHENGVVSYAEEHGWDISISVEKVQSL
jgi:hypothetical protein